MKTLFENEYICVSATGHYFDIIAIVKNKTNETMTITFNDNKEFLDIKPNDYIGILADDSGYSMLEKLKNNEFIYELRDDEQDKDLCYEIYNDIYLETFYDEHDSTDTPISFEEFYDNWWQDEDCRDWYLSIYKIQNN